MGAERRWLRRTYGDDMSAGLAGDLAAARRAERQCADDDDDGTNNAAAAADTDDAAAADDDDDATRSGGPAGAGKASGGAPVGGDDGDGGGLMRVDGRRLEALAAHYRAMAVGVEGCRGGRIAYSAVDTLADRLEVSRRRLTSG